MSLPPPGWLRARSSQGQPRSAMEAGWQIIHHMYIHTCMCIHIYIYVDICTYIYAYIENAHRYVYPPTCIHLHICVERLTSRRLPMNNCTRTARAQLLKPAICWIVIASLAKAVVSLRILSYCDLTIRNYYK